MRWELSELRAEVVRFFACWPSAVKTAQIEAFVDELQVFPADLTRRAFEQVKREHKLVTCPPIGMVLAHLPGIDRPSLSATVLDFRQRADGIRFYFEFSDGEREYYTPLEVWQSQSEATKRGIVDDVRRWKGQSYLDLPKSREFLEMLGMAEDPQGTLMDSVYRGGE